MTARALLDHLKSRGVLLEVDGDQLVVDGPAEDLSDVVVEQLRGHKSELLILLANNGLLETWDAKRWRAFLDGRIRFYRARALQQDQAERQALEDAVSQWLSLHPAPPFDPRQGCVYCGSGDQAGNSLFPALAAGGHV